MPTLPEIRIPMPEEENKTLYGYITNSGEPPKFDDIRNSNLSPEEKVRQAQYRTQAYQDDLDRQLNKDLTRMKAGTALSAVSFHPFFNIPYVGTGIGGAMYDLGQGIVEGDTASDLAKRAGRGFVIGETVGAIPYVGKALGKTKAGQAVINSAPVQAVGNVLNKAGEKFTNSKLYDVLMTDVKAFNPNKQTVYHGSPYDFEKFSNEAIGTGEGAQAHGYGHYAAKQKNIAENYADVLSNEKPIEIKYKGEKYKVNFNDDIMDWDIQGNIENLTPTERSLFEKIDSSRNLDHIKELELKQIDRMKRMQGRKNRFRDAQKSKDIINILDSGDLEILPTNKQLYKLSVPKDDVMLREDALMSNQPNMSNLWDEIRTERLLQDTSSLPKFKMALGANDIDINNAFGTKYFNEALEMAQNNPELYKDLIMQNYTGKDLYQYLTNKLGSAKAATDYLQQRGIKGISYNGGIDGEAAVIFNPDDIDIVRKFYNKPGALEYFKKINPNIGSETVAIDNGLVDKNYWKQYAKDNLIGNSVDIPGYTTVNFTNNNLMRDYPYNMPEYSNLFKQLMNSKYGFSTNYNKEKDRLYDHLINNDNNRLFDYLIEVIQDNDGNIHHNYKMMKNIMRGDKP